MYENLDNQGAGGKMRNSRIFYILTKTDKIIN